MATEIMDFIEIIHTKQSILRSIYSDYLAGLSLEDIYFKIHLDGNVISIEDIDSIIDYLNEIYI